MGSRLQIPKWSYVIVFIIFFISWILYSYLSSIHYAELRTSQDYVVPQDFLRTMGVNAGVSVGLLYRLNEVRLNKRGLKTVKGILFVYWTTPFILLALAYILNFPSLPFLFVLVAYLCANLLCYQIYLRRYRIKA